jgi:hypothetical protein
VPADELFGPDGTQALEFDAPLGDPLSGLLTGATFAAGGNSEQERAELAATRVEVPDAPAAPDQGPLKAAVDKAMMTGPPTNPLRLPTMNTSHYVRPAPTVTATGPLPVPGTRPIARRNNTRQPVAGGQPLVADDEEIRTAMGNGLAGRPSLRRTHPVVAGLLRVVIPVAFIVLLLILVLHGSGSGGNLSGLFG